MISPLIMAAERWLEAKGVAQAAGERETAARKELESLREGCLELVIPGRGVAFRWTKTTRWNWDSKKLKAVPNWEKYGSESTSERLAVESLTKPGGERP